ncbi:MAG TPA: ABC transporter transmembrane domain-containing protein, partial [Psychromonas sp.]
MQSDEQAKLRAKGASLKPLKAVVPFILPYKKILITAIVILLMASAVTGSLPIAARYLIDNGISSGNSAQIDFYFKLLLGVILLISVLSSARLYLITWLGERIVADIRGKVYAQVIRQDPLFFEVTQTGEVLSRLTTDTTLVQTISGVGISIVLRSTVMLFISLAGIIYTSPSLTLIIVLLIPAVIGPVLWLARKVRKLSRSAQDKIAQSSGMANETLNAIETVQAFTLESLQCERFGKAVEAAFIAAVKRIRLRFMMSFSSM